MAGFSANLKNDPKTKSEFNLNQRIVFGLWPGGWIAPTIWPRRTRAKAVRHQADLYRTANKMIQLDGTGQFDSLHPMEAAARRASTL